MNTIRRISLIALVIACPIFGQAQQSLKSDPAYLAIDAAIDLSTIKPEVNVNLPKFLLKNAASEFNGGPEDPFGKVGININELIQDIKLIRIVVIEGNKDNSAQIAKGTARLRAQLEKSWMPIVNVPEDNVGIYAMSDKSGEEMAGLALLINDGDEAIIGNIVGNIPLGKVLKIAASMGSGNGIDIEAIVAQFAGANIDADGGHSEN